MGDVDSDVRAESVRCPKRHAHSGTRHMDPILQFMAAHGVSQTWETYLALGGYVYDDGIVFYDHGEPVYETLSELQAVHDEYFPDAPHGYPDDEDGGWWPPAWAFERWEAQREENGES